MANTTTKATRVPVFGAVSFVAPFIGGVFILLSDYFLFLAVLLIPLVLIGGMISALIALMRRELYLALPFFGLVANPSLLAWVVHRILTSEWHM